MLECFLLSHAHVSVQRRVAMRPLVFLNITCEDLAYGGARDERASAMRPNSARAQRAHSDIILFSFETLPAFSPPSPNPSLQIRNAQTHGTTDSWNN